MEVTMQRIRAGFQALNHNKKIAILAFSAVTAAGNYIRTYFTKGSTQADEYFDKQTEALRAKFITLSDSLFDYTEDLVLAQTPDTFDPIAQRIMDKARVMAIKYREAGLDVAEDWVDSIQNTLQDHSDEIINAQSNTAVFKALRKVQKKVSSSTDESKSKIDTLVDGAIDTVSDQLEDLVKAHTSDDIQSLISKVLQNLPTSQNDAKSIQLQEKVANILTEKQEEIKAVTDTNTLNKFLEGFKNKLVSEVVDRVSNTEEYEIAPDHTDILVPDEELQTIGENNAEL